MPPEETRDEVRAVENLLVSDSTFDRIAEESAWSTPADGPTAPPAELPVIPGYVIEREIARGGMGCVVIGRELALDREVAIKMMLPGANASRFITESKITAKLPHPNIPPVYAFGTLPDGSPFLALKLVRGQTLADELKARADLSSEWSRFVQMFEQIALAVGFAHSRGVVHRDLKPQNVMVGAFGEVQVMDWGLAREVLPSGGRQPSEAETDTEARRADALRSEAADAGHTQHGAVLGTPAYMAPEQARGEAVDERADVFALGGILCAILTGQPVFAGGSVVNTIQQAAAGDTADALLRLTTCGAHAELVAVATACLQVNRDERPANGRVVAELVADYRLGVEARLKQAEADRAAAAVREAEQRKRRRVLAWSAAAVVLVLAAGVVGTTRGLYQARAQELEAKKQEKLAEEGRQKAVTLRDQVLAALRATTGEDVELLLGGKPQIGPSERAYLEAIAVRWMTFAGTEGADEQSRAVRAEGQHRVAYLVAKLGRPADARKLYEASIAALDQLTAEFPTNSEYRSHLARGRVNLGNLLTDTPEHAVAESHFRAGIAGWESLVADPAATTEVRKELARGQICLGVLLAKGGRANDAEACYRSALTVLEKLATDFPNEASGRRGLAIAYQNFGALLDALGKRADALGQLRAGLAVREKLVADFPADPDHRADLAISQASVGNLLAGDGDRTGAAEHYRAAVATQEKLVADFPAVPAYRQQFGRTRYIFGKLLSDTGPPMDGDREFRAALALQRELVRESPRAAEYRSDLALTHHSLGIAFARANQPALAEEQYRAALALQEALAAEFPKVPEHRADLAFTCVNLGVLLEPKDAEAGAANIRKSVDTLAALAADFPTVPNFRRELSKSQYKLGATHARRAQWADAEEQFRRSAATYEKLFADLPIVPGDRIGLGDLCAKLGRFLSDRGRPAEAVEWFGKAILLLRAAFEKEPQAVGFQLRDAHWNRAIMLDRLGKPADALTDWDAAVALSPAAEQSRLRARRAVSRAKAGRFAEAVADVDELSEGLIWTASQRYDFAVVYALAAREKAEYAGRAVELLRRAIAAGWAATGHMRTDAALDPLRKRDDFKKLIGDLEKKFPPPKEQPPPPRPAN